MDSDNKKVFIMLANKKYLLLIFATLVVAIFISGYVQREVPTQQKEIINQTPANASTNQPNTTIPPTPSFYLEKIEETDSSFVWYGKWQTEQNSGASGGTWKTSTSIGAKVNITFTGTGVTLYYIELPGMGIAAVEIDGVSYPEIDMYFSTPNLAKKIIATNLINANHVMTITVTGKRNSAADNDAILVDAVEVTIPS